MPYESETPGVLGGYNGSGKDRKLYGRMDCPSALRFIRAGKYVQRRVFFASESDALSAGFRPCAICMTERYRDWKAGRRP